MGTYSQYFDRPSALVLPESSVLEVEQLLRRGVPLKRICRLTGRNRETVRRIRAGKHPAQLARRQNPELAIEVVRHIEKMLAEGRSRRAIEVATGVDRLTIDQVAAGEHVSQLLGSRYQRCPAGHLAIQPCRTCAALSERERRMTAEKAKTKTKGAAA